jgi:hypothetical protein
MLNKIRVSLQITILLFGVLSFFILSMESIRLQIPERNYWQNWTRESFDCLKNELIELETSEVVSLEIADPLLFQRLVEVGFPRVDFSFGSGGIRLSDQVLPGQDLDDAFECGNWKIYVRK